MTHRNMISTFLASALTGALAFAPVAIGALTLVAPAIAEAADATCRIHVVEAKEEGDGKIPPELDFMAEELKAPAFRAYKGFAVLDVQDFKLELGKVAEKKFKSGHTLHLSLLGKQEGKLELQTKILRGSNVLVDMDFGVKSNQIVLMPVWRKDSAVIYAYQCKH